MKKLESRGWLLENKKRFEDLGIVKISKTLTDLTKSKKPRAPRQVRVRPTMEPRRSSRARTQVSTYQYHEEGDDDDDDDDELPRPRSKRSKIDYLWTRSYLPRPVEVKVASYGERARAFNSAENLRSNLQTGYPSFVKSMVESHVYTYFWMRLPPKFCEDHFPKSTTDMVLENEEGSEYEAIFTSKTNGLTGGWKEFALDHKMDDGDAVVFELIKPTRFKVYIVRAVECQNDNVSEVEEPPEKANEVCADEKPKKETNKKKTDVCADEKLKKETDKKKTDVYTDEKPEKETKKKKTDDGNEIVKSAQVSGTRRSLRNKGK